MKFHIGLLAFAALSYQVLGQEDASGVVPVKDTEDGAYQTYAQGFVDNPEVENENYFAVALYQSPTVTCATCRADLNAAVYNKYRLDTPSGTGDFTLSQFPPGCDYKSADFVEIPSNNCFGIAHLYRHGNGGY